MIWTKSRANGYNCKDYKSLEGQTWNRRDTANLLVGEELSCGKKSEVNIERQVNLRRHLRQALEAR